MITGVVNTGGKLIALMRTGRRKTLPWWRGGGVKTTKRNNWPRLGLTN
jgi:hypothetical protein